MRRAAVLIALCAVGCTATTPPWQLDHDRVIAVRATPPHIPAGGRSDLDVLITAMGDAMPTVVQPMVVQAPMGLESAVIHDDAGWAVVAPDEATLAQARAALGLDPDAPVPFAVGLSVMAGETELAAIKTVYLGDSRDNPALGDVTIDGEPAQDGIVIPTGVVIDLTIVANTHFKVDWMTSVGNLSDVNDTLGHLTTKDAETGTIAVVKRDESGGVVWGAWPVSVE